MSKEALPKDRNRETVQLLPWVAKSSTHNTTLSTTAADVITIDSDTSFFRVAPEWAKVYLKFTTGSWSASIADDGFDHVVPDGLVVDIPRPQDESITTISAIATGAVTALDIIEY